MNSGRYRCLNKARLSRVQRFAVCFDLVLLQDDTILSSNALKSSESSTSIASLIVLFAESLAYFLDKDDMRSRRGWAGILWRTSAYIAPEEGRRMRD